MSISDDYLIGFTEGEGMFYIGIVPSKETKTGWQVIYFLKVSQNPAGLEVLDIVAQKQHLTLAGITQILEIAYSMNTQKRKVEKQLILDAYLKLESSQAIR